MTAPFTPVAHCWVCDGDRLSQVHEATFDLHEYATQDPSLAAYTGASIPIVRCAACGFAQPAALPALPRFFDRMYDQRWSDDWVRAEHDSTYKDVVFADVLSGLEARVPRERRRLLDIGSHAGRFMATARRAGWDAEGLELNPKTGAYASTITRAPVHQGNVHTFDARARYDAVTLTDVLEHIPEPRTVLRRIRGFLAPGGWIAIKVPNGPPQRLKERVRGMLHSGYRPTVADNLVHVNHFTPASLARALTREAFLDVTIVAGAPEMPPENGSGRLLRRLIFTSARMVPGAVHTPLALNLQAYARRD